MPNYRYGRPVDRANVTSPVPDAVAGAGGGAARREVVLVPSNVWRVGLVVLGALAVFDWRWPDARGWLMLVAAWREVRGACCVVSAGTALTFDAVDHRGHHLGGFIAGFFLFPLVDPREPRRH